MTTEIKLYSGRTVNATVARLAKKYGVEMLKVEHGSIDGVIQYRIMTKADYEAEQAAQAAALAETAPKTRKDLNRGVQGSLQIIDRAAGGFLIVQLPFLKETDTCIVGVDASGTRRWFDKVRDCPVRDGDMVRASLTPARAKQKKIIG